MKAAHVSLCVVPFLYLAGGCFDAGPDTGVLNRAQLGNLPDLDGDGLFDIAPPQGVYFALDETLATHIRSTVTFDEAKSLASPDVPDYAAAWVTAEITLLVTYEDGSTQTLTGVFPIAPFEIHIEIACPVAVEARATLVADIPLAGRETLATFGPIMIDESQFSSAVTCGAAFELEISLNDETGRIEAVVNVE